MTKVKSLVAAIALLAMPMVSLAAPTMSATVGGLTSLNVAPGPVNLAIQGIFNSDGMTVGGYQHNVIASHPALFSYGNPSVEMTGNGGFAAADLFFSYAPGEDLPGFGSITVFKASGEAPAANNVHVETVNVVSKAALPVGSYTFAFGGSADEAFLTNAQNPFGVPFGPGGVFTLNVIPEPASALLLLAAVPFMRRRKVS
jgi:hypothetical protein